jgi:hypothetical protein
MSKSQKKALRFAYKLLCGDYRGEWIPYASPTIPYDLRNGGEEMIAPWIEPDRDKARPYLNEETFMALVMNGYFETQCFMPDEVWLYRISRDGCAKLGWAWPTHARYPLTEQALQSLNLSQIRNVRSKKVGKRPKYKISIDVNRFRRSNDWRKQ